MMDNSPSTKSAAGGCRVSLILSSLALMVALAAVGLQLFRGSPTLALRSYDLKTPKASLRSSLEMDLKGDVQASGAYYSLLNQSTFATIMSSLEIHREVEWKPDVTILFVSYESERQKRHEVVIMKKNAVTGYWIRARERIEQTEFDGIEDKKLIKEMEEWKSKRPEW